MSAVYYPILLYCHFKVFNCLDLKGLQRWDICLRSELLTWYLIVTILLFTAFLFSEHTVDKYSQKRMFVIPGDNDFVKIVWHFWKFAFLVRGLIRRPTSKISTELEPGVN